MEVPSLLVVLVLKSYHLFVKTKKPDFGSSKDERRDFFWKQLVNEIHSETAALLNFRSVNMAFIYPFHVCIYHTIEVAEDSDLAHNISQNENKHLTKHLSHNAFGLFEYLKECCLCFAA